LEHEYKMFPSKTGS